MKYVELDNILSELVKKTNKTILIDGFSPDLIDVDFLDAIKKNINIDSKIFRKFGYNLDANSKKILILQSNYENPLSIPLLSIGELRLIVSNILSLDVVRPKQDLNNKLPISTYYLKQIQDSLTSSENEKIEKNFILFQDLGDLQKRNLQSLVYHTFFGGIMNKARILSEYLGVDKTLRLENILQGNNVIVGLAVYSKGKNVQRIPLEDKKLEYTQRKIIDSKIVEKALEVNIISFQEMINNYNSSNKTVFLNMDQALKSKKVICEILLSQDIGSVFREVARRSSSRLVTRAGLNTMIMNSYSKNSADVSNIQNFVPLSIAKALAIRPLKFSSQNYIQGYKKIITKNKSISINSLNCIGESALLLYLSEDIFRNIIELNKSGSSLASGLDKSFISKRGGVFQIGMIVDGRLKIQVQFPPAVFISK